MTSHGAPLKNLLLDPMSLAKLLDRNATHFSIEELKEYGWEGDIPDDWRIQTIERLGLTKRYREQANQSKKHSNQHRLKARKIRKEIASTGRQFYRSKAWRRLRAQFIEQTEQVCVRCGSTTDLVVDHIQPRSRNPRLALEISNLQMLCRFCNSTKKDRYESEIQ